MVANVSRAWTFFRLFIKYGFAIETAYAINFLAGTCGKILRVVLLLVFFQALTINVPAIGHWDTASLYILAATFYITDLIASVLFHRTLLFHMAGLIRKGEFDRFLIQPVSTLAHVAFHRIDPGDFLTLLPFGVFLIYVVQHFGLEFSAAAILLYGVLILNAVVFIFSLTLILGSISFWAMQTDGFGRFTDHISGAARFPIDIFPKNFKRIVFYFFPIAILSIVPTLALFGKATLFDILYSIVFTALLFVVSLFTWQQGLKRYDSASS